MTYFTLQWSGQVSNTSSQCDARGRDNVLLHDLHIYGKTQPATLHPQCSTTQGGSKHRTEGEGDSGSPALHRWM